MLKAFDIDPPPLAQELFPGFMAKRPDPVQQLSAELKPKGHSTDEIRAWATGIVERFEVKPSEWARVSGLAPSTLNRFITSKGTQANLSARTIDSLDLGIRKILYSRNEGRLFKRDQYRIGYGYYTTMDVPLIGRISKYQPNAESDDHYAGRRFSFPVMFEESHFPICAFSIGSSYNGHYPGGTILFCRSVFGKRPPIIRGARYIYHRKLEDGYIEAKIYDFSSDPQGNCWLLPLSGRENHDQPLFLGRDTIKGTSEVPGRVTFLVVGHLSPNFHLQKFHAEMERRQHEYEMEREREEEQERLEEEERRAQEDGGTFDQTNEDG